MNTTPQSSVVGVRVAAIRQRQCITMLTMLILVVIHNDVCVCAQEYQSRLVVGWSGYAMKSVAYNTWDNNICVQECNLQQNYIVVIDRHFGVNVLMDASSTD